MVYEQTKNHDLEIAEEAIVVKVFLVVLYSNETIYLKVLVITIH